MVAGDNVLIDKGFLTSLRSPRVVEMAKHYGRLRMFLLRRAGDGKGPPVLSDIEREAGDLAMSR